MRVESMERLTAAVAGWRREKKHRGEKMPDELLGRVRLAARERGVNAIMRAMRVDRRRLEMASTETSEKSPSAESAPRYSRVDLTGVGAFAPAPPFAELELPSGAKLRLYSDSAQTLGLLSQVCGAERAR